jgi:outer membrane scaffolding protein for murein synthesis (MipA/OmpV family)
LALRGWAAVGAALLGTVWAGPVLAQSELMEWQYSAGVPLMPRFAPEIPTWQFTVGPAVLMRPSFPGSGRYVLQPGASIDVRYKDLAYFSTGEGLGLNLASQKSYRAGVAVTYDLGRDQDDDSRLNGMRDIDPAPEVKLYADIVAFPVVFRASVKKAVGGHRGIVGDLGAYMPVAGNKQFFVFIGPAVTFADARYMRTYFGVGSTQSQRSGYRQYRPGGGIRSTGIGLNANWNITDHWMVDTSAAAERLLGGAASSPLTRQNWNFALALNVSYRF